MSAAGLQQAQDRMCERGIDERVIGVFTHYYGQVESGVAGTIPEDTIEPLGDLPQLDSLDADPEALAEALRHTVIVKLNGGLGTSMGMTGPKSTLPVRGELTFLDVIAHQVLALRREHQASLPLLLMDSFRTREQSLATIAAYDLRVDGLPLDFLQSAEPKLTDDDELAPVSWPDDPSLEWCPPGHGDVYLSLLTSGLLDALRGKGIRYAFLSNADNLGATCDPRIPAWMAAEQVPYVAEVCERTPMDLKGGHLAVRTSDGQLVLRDSAMVVPGEEHFFSDGQRHRTFHTNNLWVDLDVLARLLDERAGVLGLPVIVNRKTVDPSRKDSTKVIQIESAMGTAIETIEGARALEVPRDRFRPVKTTNELLLVRSDVYELDEGARVVSVTGRPDPVVRLDGHYKLMTDFDERFPHGVPSIKDATSFTVTGEVTFGRDVVCIGEVTVHPADPDGVGRVPDRSHLQGDVAL